MKTMVPGIPTDVTRPPSRPGSRGTRVSQDSLSTRRWHPGSVCSICGEKIYCYQPFNYDHKVPVSKNGKRGRANKFLAHCICNVVKGNQHPFELRTKDQRQAIKKQVSAATWVKLQRAWQGMM